MRKVIVISDDTTYKQIQKYNGYPHLVISTKNDEIKSDARFLDFKLVEEEENLIDDPHRVILGSKPSNGSLYDKIITYLYHKGFDEITFLSNIHTSIENIFETISILKKYPYLRVEFEDERESIQYFEKGTYILNKESFVSFSICPFSEAIISLDYTIEKINEYKLDTSKSILKDIKFFQRIALLRVESGSVIVIRKLGEKDEN